MISNVVLTLALALATCAARGSTQDEFSLPSPDSDAGGTQLLLWATHYYVHPVAEVPSGIPLRDKSGNPLTGNLSPRQWCLGAIEGTIQIESASNVQRFNYAGLGKTAQVDCAGVLKIDPKEKRWIASTGKSYFAPARGTFGDGVSGYRLVPFRTIAVNPVQIPIGTAIFIPSARGVEFKYADGVMLKHDGYFFAADIGGAVEASHIDVFCGLSSVNCLPAFITSNKSSPRFKAAIVSDPEVIAILRKSHQPPHARK